MYRAYFGLSEEPFALTPDPRFLFMSQHHREALAHLLYGIGERGGFVQLTGEVGTGKTTLCRSLLEQVPDKVDVALILNPKQTGVELVSSICDELHVTYPPGTESIKVLTDLLNQHLLEAHAKGRRTVLIIDEAQNLSSEVLEQIRLLTNLETTTQKLLQIILIGQPELKVMMARPELRQLAQRITARYHLPPLSSEETEAYVSHRVGVAGCNRNLFKRAALKRIHRLSGGVPRLVNIISDRALLAAYGENRHFVNKSLVREASNEVMGLSVRPKRHRAVAWTLLVLLVAACFIGWRFLPWPQFAGWVAEKWSDHFRPQTVANKQAPSKILSTQREESGNAARSLLTGEPGSERAHRERGDPRGEIDRKTDSGEVIEKKGILGDLLTAGDHIPTDKETAFMTLFGYWGLDYQDVKGKNACERAIAAGLRCLQGRGNWTVLQQYNRPAILEVLDEERCPHYVVLGVLEKDHVILDFFDRQMRLPRVEVDPFWFGEFILLWRPPPLNATLLKEGSAGPDVLWLRARLDRLEGFSDEARREAANPLFDESLKRRVMDFQRAHSLRADGVVGERTLIQLNSAEADGSIPLLSGGG